MRLRAAAKLSRSVAEFDELPHGEQAEWMALALLDGEGEQWLHMVAAIRNGALNTCRASGAKVPDSAYVGAADVELFQRLNPEVVPDTITADGWAAIELAYKRQLVGIE